MLDSVGVYCLVPQPPRAASKQASKQASQPAPLLPHLLPKAPRFHPRNVLREFLLVGFLVAGLPIQAKDTHNSLNILRSGRRSFENRRRTHGRGKIRETKYNPVGAGIAPSG